MNIYDATMRAADHIEVHPELWSFGRISVPECGSPGCALGWVGHFAGVPAGESIYGVYKILGVSKGSDFYDRLHELNDDSTDWQFNAPKIPKLLRLYANKYLKQDHIPESVREIFDVSEATPLLDRLVEIIQENRVREDYE